MSERKKGQSVFCHWVSMGCSGYSGILGNRVPECIDNSRSYPSIVERFIIKKLPRFGALFSAASLSCVKGRISCFPASKGCFSCYAQTKEQNANCYLICECCVIIAGWVSSTCGRTNTGSP